MFDDTIAAVNKKGPLLLESLGLGRKGFEQSHQSLHILRVAMEPSVFP
jgi:hypothetical protein